MPRVARLLVQDENSIYHIISRSALDNIGARQNLTSNPAGYTKQEEYHRCGLKLNRGVIFGYDGCREMKQRWEKV